MEPTVLVAGIVSIALVVINFVMLFFLYLSLTQSEHRDFNQPQSDAPTITG